MQINRSKEEASISYKVKISLLMLHVPRNVSLIPMCEKTWFSCRPACRILYKTWCHACEEKRGSTSVWLRTTHRSASHSCATLCSRLTQVLVVGSSYCLKDRWGWCTCSRPACCVYLHGASWYHLSDAARVRYSRSSVHLVATWFVCWISFSKNAAQLFYLVEKFR